MRKVVCTICFCFFFLLSSVSNSPARNLIVVLKGLELEPYEIALQGFREALKSKGYDANVEEKILPKTGPGKKELVADIKRKNPRLILTLGSAATSDVSKVIKDSPVVFCMVLNPVASGFVRSMNGSDNNLAGASLDIPPQVQFKALRSIVPSARKVGVLFNPKETKRVIDEATKRAKEMELDLVGVPVASEEEVPEALRSLNGNVDALWSVADSTVFSSGSLKFILLHTLRNRIPFMGLSPAFVKAGALMALAANYREVGGQCGGIAIRILLGDPPSSLPITTPQKVTLHVNMKTAEILGIEIPPDRLKGAVVVK